MLKVRRYPLFKAHTFRLVAFYPVHFANLHVAPLWMAETKRAELEAAAVKQVQLERDTALANAAADALLAEEEQEKKADAGDKKKKNKKGKLPIEAAPPPAVTGSPPTERGTIAAPPVAVEPTEAEVVEAARAEAERAVGLEALQQRVREVVQAAEAQVAALPALAAEPEDADERLASEKHADEQAGRIAALEAQAAALDKQQSDREKRLVTKLMASREQLAEHAAQATNLRARIAALEASAAKATADWDDQHRCVVCMDEIRTHAFSPCCHLCTCAGCADNIMAKNKECPICCLEASSTFQIYVA